MFDVDKYPNCNKGYNYAIDVVEGRIKACVYVIGSCKRFLNDLERSKLAPNSFHFSPDKAERYLRLIQKFKHVKGKWKNPFIVYEPWQCFVFMNIKGFISNITGEVRFRTAHIEVPRGNAKSTMASQAALFDLSLDDPVGNEIYSAATGRDQARIVLDAARMMAEKNKSFLNKTRTKVLKHKIVHEPSNSEFKALSSDSTTLDGLIPKLAVIDELHAHRNRSVYDVIDSAMSKRNDSLMLVITTAGFDNGGIGYSQSAYAKKICLGQVEDDTFFAIVYTIDEGDDEMSEDTWIKANPGWGVSVDPINFKAKALKAKETPDSLSNFLIKHLNKWVNSLSPFFDVEKFDKGKLSNLKIENFKGEECWVALDLANKVDLCAIVYLFRRGDRYFYFTEAFLPEEAFEKSTNDSYGKWRHEGSLTVTSGAAIDYETIRKSIIDKKNIIKIKGVLYDPWNATEFAQQLEKEKIDTFELRMSTGNLSEPMKKLDIQIRKGYAHHDGGGVFRWCLGNVVAKRDANDNVFPRKENDKLKIDLAVAAIMANAGYLKDDIEGSVYNERGLIIL